MLRQRSPRGNTVLGMKGAIIAFGLIAALSACSPTALGCEKMAIEESSSTKSSQTTARTKRGISKVSAKANAKNQPRFVKQRGTYDALEGAISTLPALPLGGL